MRQAPIAAAAFEEHRRRFIASMKPNTIAIFHSNEQLARNGDQTYWPYRQNSEFYWLSGIQQEDSFLIIYPDCPIADYRTILFLKETNEHIATWEGYKLSKEEGKQLSGISTVLWNDKYEAIFRQLANYADGIYLNLNENDRSPLSGNDYEHRLAAKIKTDYPAHAIHRSAPILRKERAKHSEWGVDAMRKAIEITRTGLIDVLQTIKPGMMEFEVEAQLMGHYLRNGAKGFSFEPIVAGGKNACVLHYVTNDCVLNDGDLLLLDNGTEYNMYCSDLTRTFPINGKYTARQKQVYDAVLRVMKQAKALLRADKSLNDYNMQAAAIMEQELLSIGLITQEDIAKQDPAWPAYKKYFPHGTGHFLGIDIHDIGERYGKLEPGMVITCEPGIYIKEEGIGIRIENDILITDGDPIDLMAGFPIETDEIEYVMNQGK